MDVSGGISPPCCQLLVFQQAVDAAQIRPAVEHVRGASPPHPWQDGRPKSQQDAAGAGRQDLKPTSYVVPHPYRPLQG